MNTFNRFLNRPSAIALSLTILLPATGRAGGMVEIVPMNTNALLRLTGPTLTPNSGLGQTVPNLTVPLSIQQATLGPSVVTAVLAPITPADKGGMGHNKTFMLDGKLVEYKLSGDALLDAIKSAEEIIPINTLYDGSAEDLAAMTTIVPADKGSMDHNKTLVLDGKLVEYKTTIVPAPKTSDAGIQHKKFALSDGKAIVGGFNSSDRPKTDSSHALDLEIKEHIGKMTTLASEFKKESDSEKLKQKKDSVYHHASEAAITLRKINAGPNDAVTPSAWNAEYVKALYSANESVKTVGHWFSQDSKIQLLSMGQAMKLVDFSALSRGEIETFLARYEAEERATMETHEDGFGSPLELKDLATIKQKLKNGEINDSGLLAALELVQYREGPIHFELMDGIKNEWQLKAFRALINEISRYSYVDMYVQKKYTDGVHYASNPERLAIFKNSLGRMDTEEILFDKKFLEQASRNPHAENALKLLTDMQPLLERLGIDLNSPYITDLISHIDNDYQIGALRQFVNRQLTILPNDAESTTTERHKNKMPFMEKVGDVFFGINTRYLYGERTITHTSYEPTQADKRSLFNLIMAVGRIHNEQDNKNHETELNAYLKRVGSL